jgi:hypothetical protein
VTIPHGSGGGKKTGDSGEGPLGRFKDTYRPCTCQMNKREKTQWKFETREWVSLLRKCGEPGDKDQSSTGISERFNPGRDAAAGRVTWSCTELYTVEVAGVAGAIRGGPGGSEGAGAGKVPTVRDDFGWFLVSCLVFIYLHFLNHVSCPDREAPLAVATQPFSGYLYFDSCTLLFFFGFRLLFFTSLSGYSSS